MGDDVKATTEKAPDIQEEDVGGHASLAMVDDHPKMVLTQGTDSTIVDITKKNVTWEAVIRGAASSVSTGVAAGFWNVLHQGPDPSLKGWKKLWAPMRDTFEFNHKSFRKWIWSGLGIGFAFGAVTTAIGAIQHNRKAEKFTDEVEAARVAEKANSAGVGQSK